MRDPEHRHRVKLRASCVRSVAGEGSWNRAGDDTVGHPSHTPAERTQMIGRESGP